jgi:transcriptional regulator with XRE-family HTH domain
MNEAFTERLRRQKERQENRDLIKSVEEPAKKHNTRAKARKPKKPKRTGKPLLCAHNGQQIRSLRLRLGLSLSGMARALGENPRDFKFQLCDIENGGSQPTGKVLIACEQLARKHGVLFEAAPVVFRDNNETHISAAPQFVQIALPTLDSEISTNDRASGFVASFRSPIKQGYARDYWKYLRHGEVEDKPKRPSNLSSVAARHIRDTLVGIAGVKPYEKQITQPDKVEAQNKEGFDRSLAKLEVLPDAEQIPESEVEHHNAQIGELLMRLDDESAALLQEAHELAVSLHRGCEVAEKTKANQVLSRKLSTLSHSIGTLKTLAFQFEADEAILDSELSAEAQAWSDLLAANVTIGEIRPEEPRVGALISPLLQLARVEDGSTPLLTNAIRALVERRCDPLDPAALTRRLREARERIEELSGLWFEQERDELLTLASRRFNADRNAGIIARRYGFDGKPGGTLQEVAEEYGVSRERIRQICVPFEKELDKLASRPLFAPALDRIIAVLTERAPLSKTAAQIILDTHPDITGPVDLRDFLQWATWLGRGDVFSLEEIAPNAIYLVHPAGNRQSAETIHAGRATILKVAYKTVSRWGVAQLEDIAAKAGEYSHLSELPEKIEAMGIAKVVKSRADFHWLDEEQGWFWFSRTKRNGLVSQINKIFAVAPRVSVGELREGVARHHRREGFAPPRKVLLELCRQLPGLSVENEEVFLDPPRDLSSQLSFNEALLWEVLTQHGPAIARPALEKLCAERGMNRATFYIYLNSAPIIARYADGVFGLRGANPLPGDIQAAIESLGVEYSRLRRRVLKDFGWTHQGEIWLSYQLSPGILASGNVAFPAALKQFFKGSFALSNFAQNAVGTLTFGPAQAWGLGPFLRRGGAEADDHLLLIFDLQTKQARVALGDESLLEELSDDDSLPDEVLTADEVVEGAKADYLPGDDDLEIRELFDDN